MATETQTNNGSRISQVERLRQETRFIALLLIVFFPVGLLFLWRKHRAKKSAKILISCVFIILFIAFGFGIRALANNELLPLDAVSVWRNTLVLIFTGLLVCLLALYVKKTLLRNGMYVLSVVLALSGWAYFISKLPVSHILFVQFLLNRALTLKIIFVLSIIVGRFVTRNTAFPLPFLFLFVFILTLPAVFLMRGHIRVREKKALTLLSRAIELNPRCAHAYASRMHLYFVHRRLDGVISDTTRLIALEPDVPFAYTYRALAYHFKKMNDAAIRDLSKAIALDPQNDRRYAYRAEIYAKDGMYDEAISDYTRAIELNPKRARLYIYRGYVYMELEMYDDAIEDYNQLLALSPRDSDGYNNRGYVYLKKEMYAQAIADFSRAITLTPKDATAYSYRGRSFFLQGAYTSALDDYNKAVELNSDYCLTYFYLGEFHDGDYNNKAIEWYERFLACESEDTDKISAAQDRLEKLKMQAERYISVR